MRKLVALTTIQGKTSEEIYAELMRQMRESEAAEAARSNDPSEIGGTAAAEGATAGDEDANLS
jgi:hypothetical protein